MASKNCKGCGGSGVVTIMAGDAVWSERCGCIKKRCKATVFKRDTYRRTGRGKHGFEMHYTEDQCSFSAKSDSKFCGKHQSYTGVEKDWSEFVSPHR